MSYRELLEWAVYFQYDPPLGERMDFHSARLLAMQAAAAGGKGDASDFIFDWQPAAPEPKTTDQVLAARNAVAAALRARGAVRQ